MRGTIRTDMALRGGRGLRRRLLVSAGLTLAVAALVVMGLGGCKPIAYYLAQVYKVHGQVTADGSGDPVGSVEVFVDDSYYTELTNYNGDYEMELPEGTWTISFVKEGYEPHSTEVTVGPGADAEESVLLDVKLIAEGIDILGSWTITPFRGPYVPIFHFSEDGTLTIYGDYAETMPEETSSWSLDGDLLTLFGDETYRLGVFSSDRYRLQDPDDPEEWEADLYRKGTEPEGSIFDFPATELPADAWFPDAIPSDGYLMYTYTATVSGVHQIRWDCGSDGSGGYEATIEVTGYGSDQLSVYFQEEDGYSSSQPVDLAAGDMIYLFVMDIEGPEGSFALRVDTPPAD